VRFHKKNLLKFESFLKEKLELVSKMHYTKLGAGLGISFGILFGVIALSSMERSLSISFGMIIGMVIGIAIGKSMDTKAKNEGRVL